MDILSIALAVTAITAATAVTVIVGWFDGIWAALGFALFLWVLYWVATREDI